MLRRSASLAAVTLSGALVLSGCGASAREQVVTKVRQYAHATAARDYRTLCTQVLAPSLLSHLRADGVPCEQAMRVGLQSVRDPSLGIGRVVVHGRTASVTTITTAVGQEASLDAIELVDTAAGWRISSLGAPQLPGATQRP
jgi:hypothetical protein